MTGVFRPLTEHTTEQSLRSPFWMASSSIPPEERLSRTSGDPGGATALAERAREELIIAGGRPRRAARTGLEALTPAENRVALLVAQGLTNGQIASSLFVSTRTVTTHLTHVYEKLGIAHRQELSSFLKKAVNASVL